MTACSGQERRETGRHDLGTSADASVGGNRSESPVPSRGHASEQQDGWLRKLGALLRRVSGAP